MKINQMYEILGGVLMFKLNENIFASKYVPT